MFYVYTISHAESDRQYVGYTNSLQRRRASHTHSSKTKTSPLYSWMRRYPAWEMVELASFKTKQEAIDFEIQCIASGDYNLNLAPGGEGGYVIPEEKEKDWKAKLRKARVGRKPALGMKHTDETKAKCSLAARLLRKRKWTPAEEAAIGQLSCKDAMKKYKISKTHYYRLKNKRLTVSDSK